MDNSKERRLPRVALLSSVRHRGRSARNLRCGRSECPAHNIDNQPDSASVGAMQKRCAIRNAVLPAEMTGPYGPEAAGGTDTVVRDRRMSTSGNAQAMHKDLCGQEEHPTEQQLNNILDGMKTQRFPQKTASIQKHRRTALTLTG